MGKYIDFPSQQPYVRPKSAIYTPKRDDEHHFYMGVSPPGAPSSTIKKHWDKSIRKELLVLNCKLRTKIIIIQNNNDNNNQKH